MKPLRASGSMKKVGMEKRLVERRIVAVGVPKTQHVNTSIGFVDFVNDAVDSENEDFAGIGMIAALHPAATTRADWIAKFKRGLRERDRANTSPRAILPGEQSKNRPVRPDPPKRRQRCLRGMLFRPFLVQHRLDFLESVNTTLGDGLLGFGNREIEPRLFVKLEKSRRVVGNRINPVMNGFFH